MSEVKWGFDIEKLISGATEPKRTEEGLILIGNAEYDPADVWEDLEEYVNDEGNTMSYTEIMQIMNGGDSNV